jgi:Family of unknown function (DUF6064)
MECLEYSAKRECVGHDSHHPHRSGGVAVNLPFTRDQFFEVFAAYNRSLWPFALVLWGYALAAAVLLARGPGRRRFAAVMLAVQWAWAGVAYHAAFFTAINPAAWLFALLFVIEGGLLVWFGVIRDQLQFSATGSLRHVAAWTLIIYALLYPLLAQAEGHAFPRGPTFGVPCPTTFLTIGWLLAADPPGPKVVALIPIGWALLGGAAAVLLGVRADLMLWVGGIALTASVLASAGHRVHA